MKDRIQQAFRIFLHLCKLREAAGSFPEETLAPFDTTQASWIPSMAARLLAAEKAQTRRDWLGCETELFRMAALVFSAIESHQELVGAEPIDARERWCWESTPSRRGPSFGSSPSKARAIAQAEATVPAGETYRLGLVAPSSIQHYVPKAEWLTEQMRDQARKEHSVPKTEWPQLDPNEYFELQTLLDGLVVGFLEQKGILPNFPTCSVFENRVVPAQDGYSALRCS